MFDDVCQWLSNDFLCEYVQENWHQIMQAMKCELVGTTQTNPQKTTFKVIQSSG